MEDKKLKFNWIKEIVPYLIIILIVLFVKRYVVTTVVVHGDSMLPTLHDKDIMVLNEIGIRFSSIKRYDIVVIKTDKTKIIKRVIGLPGEVVEYFDGNLYINGEIIEDPYNNGNTNDFKEVKLGDDEYFVLGDNRSNSADSRIIGPIDKSDILGRATFTIFPFNRLGKK